MKKRSGTKFIYACEPGEQLKLLPQPHITGALAIVVHPERPPAFLMPDGSLDIWHDLIDSSGQPIDPQSN